MILNSKNTVVMEEKTNVSLAVLFCLFWFVPIFCMLFLVIEIITVNM